PNAFGGYDEGPAEMIAVMREWAERGWVNILGGCCGTTPEHIAVFAEAVAGLSPRQPASHEPVPRFAGLEPLVIRRAREVSDGDGDAPSRFVNVGERTNLTGPNRFKRLVGGGDPAAAVEGGP